MEFILKIRMSGRKRSIKNIIKYIGSILTTKYICFVDVTEFKLSDKIQDQAKRDKMFLTEILNDIHRNGFIKGGKAETMLRDWSHELRDIARPIMPASKLKTTF